jgi:hypothetical protein
MECILFVADCSRFQTRSMLIPVDRFPKAHYDLLKKHSISRTIKEYHVENLLLRNIVWEGNVGTGEHTEYSKLCHQLESYADGMDEDCYYNMDDKPWVDNAIGNLCKGFNHLRNYTICKNITHYKGKDIKIVDAFLCLTMDDNKLDLWFLQY